MNQSSLLAVVLLGLASLPVAAEEPAAASPQAARAASAAVQEAEPAVASPSPPATPVAPRPAKGVRAPKGANTEGAPSANSPKAIDRLELDITQITGNRELPKVMVIVPWKRADIGELLGRPVNSLIDESLQPVDREVFRRELDYYGTLAPDRPRSETRVTGGSASDKPEK